MASAVEPTPLAALIYGRQSRNKAKSIDEQLTAGSDVADENGWRIAGRYSDGSSASIYATKGRDDWQRVLDDIEAGTVGVLILWEASRGDRTLTTWSAFLDLCRAKGCLIYVVNDEQLYDVRKPRHWKTLANAGVDSASESDLISSRVRRGQAGAAAAGRPAHGRVPFGYVRRYNPETGALVGQEPDPIRAPIVREVFERLAKGEPVASIVKDFNRRKVLTSGTATRWYRSRLRIMAANRVYIGERTYHEATIAGEWPALIDPTQFFAAQRILSDPARRITRPGRAVHWLSYIATATPCGGQLTAFGGRYRCERDKCTSAVQADVDKFVEDMLLDRLQQPDVYEMLRQAAEDGDRDLLAAYKEEAELKERLETWRLAAARGQASPETVSVVEAEVGPLLTEVQRRIARAQVPPEFRTILEPGADIRQRWADSPMAAKRRIIARWAEIRLGPVIVRSSRHAPFNPARLGQSRWVGDELTWGDRWAANQN